MKNKSNTPIEVKPYNIKELAALYGVGRKPMVRWLKAHRRAIGKKEGQLYTALQVKIIFDKLGLPSQIEEE